MQKERERQRQQHATQRALLHLLQDRFLVRERAQSADVNGGNDEKFRECKSLRAIARSNC